MGPQVIAWPCFTGVAGTAPANPFEAVRLLISVPPWIGRDDARLSLRLHAGNTRRHRAGVRRLRKTIQDTLASRRSIHQSARRLARCDTPDVVRRTMAGLIAEAIVGDDEGVRWFRGVLERDAARAVNGLPFDPSVEADISPDDARSYAYVFALSQQIEGLQTPVDIAAALARALDV